MVLGSSPPIDFSCPVCYYLFMITPGDTPNPELNDAAIRGLVEGLLHDTAEVGQMLLDDEAETRRTEGVVALALLRAGAQIPNLEGFGEEGCLPMHEMADIYEMGEMLRNTTISEELATLAKAHGRQPLKNPRQVGLMLREASIIASTLGYYESVGPRNGTVSEFKVKQQFEILEDEEIGNQNKAILLDVLDELVPVEGIDVTDQETFDELRRLGDVTDEHMKTLRKARGIVKSIVATELIPAYGEHDDYGELQVKLRCYLGLQKMVANGEMTADIVQGLADYYMNAVTSAATNIGIPQDVLRSVIAKAEFDI